MTDRYNILTVVLEKDVREDDAECTINAIKQLKGVLRVKGNVASATDYMAEERAKHELGQKILEVVFPPKGSRL